MTVRTYECTVYHKPDGYTEAIPAEWSDGSLVQSTHMALSAGRARNMCRLNLLDAGWEVRFQDIRVRVVGAASERQRARVKRISAMRGLPFVQLGMKVECEGHPGVIAGANDSANWDVLFTDGPHKGLTLNCHPTWKMRYFADDGTLIHDSEVAR